MMEYYYTTDIAKYQKLRDYNGDALIQCNEKVFEDFYLSVFTVKLLKYTLAASCGICVYFYLLNQFTFLTLSADKWLRRTRKRSSM